MIRPMTLLIAVLPMLTLPVSATAGQSAPAPSVVVTRGEAVVRRVPDRAWLTLATETREPQAAEARRRGAESMTELQNSIRAVGIPADAIRTTGFSLVPEMEWKNGRGTVRGYLVRNQIEVRVDELDRLGDVIESANNSRSTAVSVIGPRFGLRDETSAQNDAVREAVQAAMTRARAIAAGAGRSLGSILRIEEPNVVGFAPMADNMGLRAMAAKEAVETPISPGEIEFRATVTITVELR